MKAPVSFDNFPTFAANGSRDMNPESGKYSVGFVPADTFPAEWANYMFHGATKGVSDLNTAVASIWAENANVLTQAGITPAAENNGQLYSAIMKFINDAVLTANQQILAQAKLDAHPVGSLYWSSSPTDPATLFGGTWTRIKDRFVLAAGDTYGNGATGGSATVQLTESNLPAHSHACSWTDINHTHSGTTGSVSNKYGSANTSYMSENQNHTHNQLVYTGGQSNISHVYGYSILASNKGKDSGFGYAYQPSYEGNTGYPYNQPTNIDHTHNFDHAHDFTTGGMSANWNHSHTVYGGGNGTASGNAHENMPPYIVKFCWERTA